MATVGPPPGAVKPGQARGSCCPDRQWERPPALTSVRPGKCVPTSTAFRWLLTRDDTRAPHRAQRPRKPPADAQHWGQQLRVPPQPTAFFWAARCPALLLPPPPPSFVGSCHCRPAMPSLESEAPWATGPAFQPGEGRSLRRLCSGARATLWAAGDVQPPSRAPRPCPQTSLELRPSVQTGCPRWASGGRSRHCLCPVCSPRAALFLSTSSARQPANSDAPHRPPEGPH